MLVYRHNGSITVGYAAGDHLVATPALWDHLVASRLVPPGAEVAQVLAEAGRFTFIWQLPRTIQDGSFIAGTFPGLPPSPDLSSSPATIDARTRAGLPAVAPMDPVHHGPVSAPEPRPPIQEFI